MPYRPDRDRQSYPRRRKPEPTWLPDAFDRAAQAHRSHTALVEEGRSWTFGELADESDAIAAMLREKVAGDTVGVLLLNSQKYVTTLLGVWKAGKTPVPLNYLLPPQELAYIIKDSGMGYSFGRVSRTL